MSKNHLSRRSFIGKAGMAAAAWVLQDPWVHYNRALQPNPDLMLPG